MTLKSISCAGRGSWQEINSVLLPKFATLHLNQKSSIAVSARIGFYLTTSLSESL